MSSEHHLRIIDRLRELAARFVADESSGRGLITVTNVILNDGEDHAVFLVSIYPEDAEGPALGFLMRKRGECRAYIAAHARLRTIPHVEFAIDHGEKERRRVETLLSE